MGGWRGKQGKGQLMDMPQAADSKAAGRSQGWQDMRLPRVRHCPAEMLPARAPGTPAHLRYLDGSCTASPLASSWSVSPPSSMLLLLLSASAAPAAAETSLGCSSSSWQASPYSARGTASMMIAACCSSAMQVRRISYLCQGTLRT
jgi:hypothetical protein